LAACPEKALNIDETLFRIDYKRCTGCGKCVEVCYYGAMVAYGEEMTAEAVFDKVRRDKMFYAASGGGITVSGGEPLLEADFVQRLFALCKQDGIGTCIETSGFVGEKQIQAVRSVTDLFLFDLKHMDPTVHKRYTAHRNERILLNAMLVAQSGADVLFRIPLIPAVNDTVENIKATSDFVKSVGCAKVQLMPFHRIGQSKYLALGKSYAFHETEVPSGERIAAVRQAYISKGVECTVSM
jgi:pyruvate formate lyase activating enzyme